MFDVRETDIQLLGDTNIQLTQALFIEFNPSAPFTMKMRDKVTRSGHVARSVYQVYMNSVDEYDAAMRVVGNMEHWRKLCSLKWFMEGIPGKADCGLKQWRKDMAMRDASTAKGYLLGKAQDGNVQAARYLHEVSTKSNAKKKDSKEASKEKEEGEVGVVSMLERARQIQGG